MTLKSRVTPFGNLRIKVCSQLPEAYRNVLRPSSPLNAKASTKRPFHTLLNSQTFFIHKYKKIKIEVFNILNIHIHSVKNLLRQVGGGGRDRTDDLRLAKPALSQLSYAPSPYYYRKPSSTQQYRNGGPG